MTQDHYWVYVLRNPMGRFYIGVTDDVVRRLNDHNTGRSQWTKKFGPWEFVWTKGSMSLSAARKLESLLKRQKGGDGFFSMTGLRRSSGS